MNRDQVVEISRLSDCEKLRTLYVRDNVCIEYVHLSYASGYKKFSYCCETVRREGMPRIPEMDVEMTT